MWRCTALVTMATAAALGATPNLPLTVDYNSRFAPPVGLYQANARTIDVTLRNGNAAVPLTGCTPFMWFAPTNTSASVATAACSIVSATGGMFTAAFSPAQVNTNGAFVYGVGISSNGVMTARQGVLVVTPDPYAAGAGPVHWASVVDYRLYAWTNFPWMSNDATWQAIGTSSGLLTRVDGTNAYAIYDEGNPPPSPSIPTYRADGTYFEMDGTTFRPKSWWTDMILQDNLILRAQNLGGAYDVVPGGAWWYTSTNEIDGASSNWWFSNGFANYAVGGGGSVSWDSGTYSGASTPAVDLTGDWTYATWIYFRSSVGGHRRLFVRSSGAGYVLLMGGMGNGYWLFSDGNNGQPANLGGALSDTLDTWTHVAIVAKAAGGVDLYENGEFKGTTAGAFVSHSGGTMSMGPNADETVAPDAYMDESALWTRALASNEIYAIATTDKRIETVTNGLAVLHRWDDGAGASAADSSGNARASTLTAAAWESSNIAVATASSPPTNMVLATLNRSLVAGTADMVLATWAVDTTNALTTTNLAVDVSANGGTNWWGATWSQSAWYSNILWVSAQGVVSNSLSPAIVKSRLRVLTTNPPAVTVRANVTMGGSAQ